MSFAANRRFDRCTHFPVMDPATWSSKQWIAASVVAGAALSALVVVRQSLAEATRKAQLAPAAPVRRVPKRAPQKHTLGQVALPKSAHFPDPSGTERDYSVFATPEELDSLRQSPPALDYPLTNDQLQVCTVSSKIALFFFDFDRVALSGHRNWRMMDF